MYPTSESIVCQMSLLRFLQSSSDIVTQGKVLLCHQQLPNLNPASCPWPACLLVRMLSEKHLLPRLFVGFPVLLLGSPDLYFLSVPGTPFLFQVLSVLDSAKQNPAFGQYSGNSDRQGKKDEVSVRRVATCVCTVLSLSLILCPWTNSGSPLASVPHSIGNLMYQLFCCCHKTYERVPSASGSRGIESKMTGRDGMRQEPEAERWHLKHTWETM